MTDQPDIRSLLALDYGTRRIGVATGSLLTGTANPLTTLKAAAGQPDWSALTVLIREWQPDLIVLGLPRNTDGTESDMTARVRAFAAELKNKTAIPLEFVDERYTSAEAEAVLREERRRGARKKKLTKADVDATAARIIAESWMRNAGKSPKTS